LVRRDLSDRETVGVQKAHMHIILVIIIIIIIIITIITPL